MGMRTVCALMLLAACTRDTLPAHGHDVDDRDFREVLGLGLEDGGGVPNFADGRDANLADGAEADPEGVKDANLEDVEATNPEGVEDGQLEGVEDADRGDVYDPDRLVIYKLRVGQLAEERLATNPREYVPATLEFVDGDATEHMEVGLRLKGEATFRTLDGKAAFRIKVDKFHSGQRLRGLRALTLNNMLQDSTLMAERLAYHVFREMGAPAPRANHAMVYVNDVYFGLYANIETPNEDLLARWFEDPDRNLYEEAGIDFDEANAADSFERETHEKQSDDREHLRALAEACSAGDLKRARELVDWPKFMLFSALEASTNQVDGYSYAQAFANNYRIYDSADGFVFIPWGLDWTFGPVATQDGSLFVDPLWVRPEHGVLMRMCLADQECTREYVKVVELVAARWDGMKLEDLMGRWIEQTEEAFAADLRREVTLEAAQADRETSREFIRGRARALLEAIAQ
jgi:hypothetical protein